MLNLIIVISYIIFFVITFSLVESILGDVDEDSVFSYIVISIFFPITLIIMLLFYIHKVSKNYFNNIKERKTK